MRGCPLAVLRVMAKPQGSRFQSHVTLRGTYNSPTGSWVHPHPTDEETEAQERRLLATVSKREQELCSQSPTPRRHPHLPQDASGGCCLVQKPVLLARYHDCLWQTQKHSVKGQPWAHCSRGRRQHTQKPVAGERGHARREQGANGARWTEVSRRALP